MGKKILLVDDDPLVLESVAAALEVGGHRVWTSASAEEALRLAADLEPDVVVTDYRMPGMDGVSLLEALGEPESVSRMVIYSAEPPPRGRLAERLQGLHWVAKSPGHAALLEVLAEILRV